MKSFEVKATEAGSRLDSLLAARFPGLSRSYFAVQIKEERIKVNGKHEKPSYTAREKDRIEMTLLENAGASEIKPQEIDVNVIFEDENVIVINKQAGITVHPGAGNKEGTLVNALVNYFPNIKEAVFIKNNTVSESRPGIVHRLDKDTSGVMIVAKNSRALHSLARQIQNRTVEKEYLALNFGWPKEEKGKLTNYLGRHPVNRKVVADIGAEKGREAISDYYVDEYYSFNNARLSLLRFYIHTGRTHQIRVQSKLLGNPIIGDRIYNTRESMKISATLGAKRQMLHACKLAVTLPGEEKRREFTAPIAKDFDQVLKKLSTEE